MSSSGSSKAVLAALSANLGIAVIKFIAFAITGSSSMLAEGVHSVVDSGNQGLLLVGGRSSRQQATPEHPFGYGRDRYVYGFLVALMLFSAGGLFALYEGVAKVRHPHHLDSPAVALVVLAVAVALESFSLRTAVHESRPHKGSDSWVEFIRHAKVPELPVVLLEDVAALIGLMLALFGVGLSTLTHQAVWDGIGTLGIGVLLIMVAVILVIETKEPAGRGGSRSGAGAGDCVRAARWRGRPDHPPAHDAPRPGRTAGRGEDLDGRRHLLRRRRRRDRRRRGAGACRRPVGSGDLPRARPRSAQRPAP